MNREKKRLQKLNPWEKTLSELVLSFLTHDPCGSANGNPYASCQVRGKCKSHMPRDIKDETDAEVDGYAHYRRRENYLFDGKEEIMPRMSRYIVKKKKDGKRAKNGFMYEFGNQWVPGYNPALLMKYRCHINVEYCGSIKAIKYLYKYIHKGTDKGYMKLKQFKEEKDEIYLHKYGRVMTANECHYNIAGFPRHQLCPSVTRLGFFVHGKKNVKLRAGKVPTEKEIKEQIENTPYWKWFHKNKEEFDIINSWA